MSLLRTALPFAALVVALAACATPEPTADPATEQAATETRENPALIDGARARARVAAGARLVDVRTPAEFATGAVEGAVNIPVQVLESRLAELNPKDQPIVLYCRSGRRSAIAADMLVEAGFVEVYDLGRLTDW